MSAWPGTGEESYSPPAFTLLPIPKTYHHRWTRTCRSSFRAIHHRRREKSLEFGSVRGFSFLFGLAVFLARIQPPHPVAAPPFSASPCQPTVDSQERCSVPIILLHALSVRPHPPLPRPWSKFLALLFSFLEETIPLPVPHVH